MVLELCLVRGMYLILRGWGTNRTDETSLLILEFCFPLFKVSLLLILKNLRGCEFWDYLLQSNHFKFDCGISTFVRSS